MHNNMQKAQQKHSLAGKGGQIDTYNLVSSLQTVQDNQDGSHSSTGKGWKDARGGSP